MGTTTIVLLAVEIDSVLSHPCRSSFSLLLSSYVPKDEVRCSGAWPFFSLRAREARRPPSGVGRRCFVRLNGLGEFNERSTTTHDHRD